MRIRNYSGSHHLKIDCNSPLRASGFFINFTKAVFDDRKSGMNGRFWFGTSFLTQLTLIFSFAYAFLSFEFYGVIIVIQVSVFVGYKHRCKRLETTKFGAVTLLRYIFGQGLHPKKLTHYPAFIPMIIRQEL